MAEKTDIQLQTYADTNINTNGANAITGALHNTMLTDMIDSKVNVDAMKDNKAIGVSSDGSFSIIQYRIGTRIIIEYVSGTPVLKLGTSAGGNDIMRQETISGDIINNKIFAGSLSAAWNLHYTLSGGVVNIFVRTESFRS